MRCFFFIATLFVFTLMGHAQTNDVEANAKANRAAGRADVTVISVTPQNDEDGDIGSVIVSYRLTNGLEKKIRIAMPWPVESFTGGETSDVDIDFDGVDDLQVELGLLNGTGTNMFYAGLLWNKDKQEFVEVEDYCNIVNATPDPGNRCINGFIIETPHITVQKWEWKNGALELTHEHEENLMDED